MKHAVHLLLAIGALAEAGPAQAQSVINYGYDARGRLVEVADGRGIKSTYGLDPADNRTGVAVVSQFATSWEAEALPHVIGYADGDGWAANVTLSSNFLTYGPYSTNVPVGQRVGVWRMMIDVRDVADNSPVVTLDVYDATAGQQLASRTVTRHAWSSGFAYQTFELPFAFDAARAGHMLELRTYYHGAAYVRVEKIGYY